MTLAERTAQGLACTFRVADLLCCIDVDDVQEIIRCLDVTPVPRAPSSISGIINLRGEIVTSIDLRHSMGLPKRDADSPSPMHMVVTVGGILASLEVDTVGDVIDVDPESVEPRPASLDGVANDLVESVLMLDDELVLMLDAVRIVEELGARSSR